MSIILHLGKTTSPKKKRNQIVVLQMILRLKKYIFAKLVKILKLYVKHVKNIRLDIKISKITSFVTTLRN